MSNKQSLACLLFLCLATTIVIYLGVNSLKTSNNKLHLESRNNVKIKSSKLQQSYSYDKCIYNCSKYPSTEALNCAKRCRWDKPPIIEKEYIPKCPQRMTYVKPGDFLMGCSPAEKFCITTMPKHVRISTGFCMDTSEVTQEEFAKIKKINEPVFKCSVSDYCKDNINDLRCKVELLCKAVEHKINPSFFKNCGTNCPVEMVSWHDAYNYCKLTGKRLPTEAEWEYSARGGATTKYYWGTEVSGDFAWYYNNSYIDYKSNCDDCYGRGTHIVRTKLPNAFGLYDMIGNVGEWVQDSFDGGGYYDLPSENPVRGLNTESTYYDFRVIRGGNWDSRDDYITVSHQYMSDAEARGKRVGFRCVTYPL